MALLLLSVAPKKWELGSIEWKGRDIPPKSPEKGRDLGLISIRGLVRTRNTGPGLSLVGEEEARGF